jgi:hypothetical protein
MMKKLLAAVLAGLLIGFVTAPAFAWEFSLSGDFQWGYDYFTQAGSAGFFGPHNQVNASGASPFQTNYRSMNAWVGARTINQNQYGLVTGKDASLNYMRVEFYPEIRINPAIRLRGWYQIGTFENLQLLATYGLYVNSSNPGAWNPISTGEWNQWWATAETPWGILVVGKRPLAFGIGAQYDGTNVTSESLLLVAPYGPFRIGLGIYPYRRALWVNSTPIAFQASSLFFGQGDAGPGGFSRQTISTPLDNSAFSSGAYVKPWDHDSVMIQQPIAFITYRTGPLDVGILYEWLKEHEGPQSASFNAQQTVQQTRDSTVEDGCVYVKYNNGRFFFNSELAWVRVQSNFQRSLLLTNFVSPAPVDPGDGGGSQYAPYSNEVWKFMTELGAICGPAKISFLYSWVPGPDRRHGIWINNQSWENIAGGQYLGNAQAFRPYSLLMGYQYGAGLNAINWNGEGYMTDASSWGARLDYAVAANLNVYGTFFYATRVSKGWGWSSLVPVSGNDVALLGTGDFVAQQNLLTNGAPSIPDDSLGWEVTAGVEWKLLESLTLRARGAYWQPGRWFKYACMDKTLVTFTNDSIPTLQQSDGAAIGSSWGVNPSRSIDPIWGFQSYLIYDF